MTAAARFTIGSEVVCSDGACGELIRVVVDPVARTLTHLVVEPRSHQGIPRLVPIELAQSAGPEVRLSCSLAEFRDLLQAEQTRVLDGSGGQQQADPMLPFILAPGGANMIPVVLGRGITTPEMITQDRVPDGAMELRGGEHVHATDGEIGRIHGFVTDPTNHGLTHVLLDEGHLRGKKTVAIPISAIKDFDFGVRLKITKDEVGDLPSVDLHDPQ